MAKDSGVAAFGEELRKLREQRGLAVETICETTKVPARHIRALESGDLQEIPGGVFRKGFVRSYLSALGLEEALWMKRFEETCRASGVGQGGGDMDWTRFAENVKNNRRELPSGTKAKNTGIGILLIVLALAALCIWRAAHHRRLIPIPMALARAVSVPS